MKFLVPFLTKLYQYATVFLIAGSPLFFIPGTGFAPEVTYYVTMMSIASIALAAYVLSALITHSWHSVSRLEFISYFAFSGAVLLSVVFARDPRIALFGEAFNPLAGASLLTLPVIVYLVRTLPDTIRLRMKYVLAIVLGVSMFVFMSAIMMNGTLIDTIKQLFLGFSSATSFGVYVGIFIVAAFFFARKAKVSKKFKAIVLLASIVFLSWILSIATNDAVRPNFASSMSVAKNVMLNDGAFGIGAGEYARGWQLYRPESVIMSPFFGYEFNQGFSTITTFLTTIGIVGIIAFILLTLSALYSTWRSYRLTTEGEEHVITGFLALTLLYLAIVSWVAPLSFALLVVWMVIAGFGFAKANLSEYHPSKKLAFLFVPLALILLMNTGILVQKVRAFSSFGKAQNILAQSGPTEEAGAFLNRASEIYEHDGFYRGQVEYIIALERLLVSTPSEDQTALQTKYLENAQKAVDAGLAAVRVNPGNYQNYVSLGRAYELAVPFDAKNGYERSKKAYEEAVKLYPNNPYLYVMLARLEASAGTKEGVETQLTEALKKKQNFADALYLMSQLRASEQNIDEALTYAIEAVRNAPNDPLVYVQAGLLLYGKKDYENAAAALNTALEKDPNNANIAYFLALSLREWGKVDLARPLAEELLKRNPDNADIQALVKSLQPQQPAAPAKK